MDLSYGNYSINKVDLNYCGDKAISIGEKSLANINKAKINNSKIGISAKDSSSVLVEESLIFNSEICFSVDLIKLLYQLYKLVLKQIYNVQT